MIKFSVTATFVVAMLSLVSSANAGNFTGRTSYCPISPTTDGGQYGNDCRNSMANYGNRIVMWDNSNTPGALAARGIRSGGVVQQGQPYIVGVPQQQVIGGGIQRGVGRIGGTTRTIIITAHTHDVYREVHANPMPAQPMAETPIPMRTPIGAAMASNRDVVPSDWNIVHR